MNHDSHKHYRCGTCNWSGTGDKLLLDYTEPTCPNCLTSDGMNETGWCTFCNKELPMKDFAEGTIVKAKTGSILLYVCCQECRDKGYPMKAIWEGANK